MDTTRLVEFFVTCFEMAGVIVLVLGAVLAVVAYAVAVIRRESPEVAYRGLRRDLGKVILIGLELLVVADIIRSVESWWSVVREHGPQAVFSHHTPPKTLATRRRR